MININNNLVYKAGEFQQEILANSTESFKNKNIMSLPNESIRKILSNLDTTQDILTSRLINKRLLNIIDATSLLERKIFNSCHQAQSNPRLSVFYYNLELRNWLKNFDDPNNELINYLDDKRNNIYFKQILFFTIAKVMSKTRNLTYKKIITIEHEARVNHVCFNLKTDTLVTSSDDKTATVWQFKNNMWEKLKSLNNGDKVTHSMFSPSGCHLFTFSKCKITIWQVIDNSFSNIQVIQNCYKSLIYFRNDSERFFIKTLDGPIKIFDLIDNDWVEVLAIDEIYNFFDPKHSKFKQDSLVENNIRNDQWLKFILQQYCIIHTVYGSNISDNAFLDHIKELVYGSSYGGMTSKRKLPRINIICSSSDMKLIYISTAVKKEGCIILEYKNKNWQVKVKFQGDTDTRKACFSPDNKRIITMRNHTDTKENQARIWNITDNIVKEEACILNVYNAKFSPDSIHIVIASSIDCQIQILGFIDKNWKVKTIIDYFSVFKQDFCFWAQTQIENAYFSNDGRFIASISSKNSVEILEINGVSKNSPIEVIDHTSLVTMLINAEILNTIEYFYSNSNSIITTFKDNTVQISQLKNGLWQQEAILNNVSNITNVMFSPDRLHFITSSDAEIKIWMLTDNKWQYQLTIKKCYKSNIDFRKDSKRFFIATQNEQFKIFDLINNNWVEVLVIDEIYNFFDPLHSEFKQNILIENNIKNDEWLKLILQIYIITQAAREFYSCPEGIKTFNRTTDNYQEFKDKIKDMLDKDPKWYGFSVNKSASKSLISYSTNLKLIYIGTQGLSNSTILEYTNNDWQIKVKFQNNISKVCFSYDNKKIITSFHYKNENEHNARIWDITGNEVKEELYLRNVYNVNFSTDSRYILTVSSKEESATIWKFIDQTWQVIIIINHKSKTKHDFFNSSINRLEYAYLSSDNKFITTIAADKTVKTSDIQFLLEDR